MNKSNISYKKLQNLTPPLTQKAKKYFEVQRLETGLQNGFLFTKSDKVSHYANNSLFYNTYREILDKAGLDRRSLHNTRHTFASMMLNNQIDPMWVSSILGHKNLDITLKVYTHYIPKKEKMVIDFLKKRYKSYLTPPINKGLWFVYHIPHAADINDYILF